MIFIDSQKAYNWLIENPFKRLYINDSDNYVQYEPYECQIRYFYIIDDERNHYIYEYRYIESEEEFINSFNNVKLNNNYA